MKIEIKKILPITLYLISIIILEIIFWTNKYDCGLGFGIITYYALFPLNILIISIFYSSKIKSNKIYFLSLFLGLSIMIFEYTTYSLGNMLSFKKINLPSISTFLIYSGISFVGIIIGKSIKSYKTKPTV